MQEPSVRTSRLAIAGGVAAMLVLGGGGFLAGRATAPPPPAPAPVMVATPTPPPVREVQKELDRAGLLALARSAADAFASGTIAPRAIADAAGQRFDLLLPFGCAGPSDAGNGPPMQWHYDADDTTLRVTVRPMSWTGVAWGIEEQAGIDAAEGFWIARPWSSSGSCPARVGEKGPGNAESAIAPEQTLAIAQFFLGEADRNSRRKVRPLETVQRIAADKFDASQGFRLRLSGRIEAIGGASPVRCVQPAGAEQRPQCVIGARIDTVRLENPADGEALATWTIGRSGQ